MILVLLQLLAGAWGDFGASNALYGREQEAKLDAVAVDRSVDLSRLLGERVEIRVPGDAGDTFTCVIPNEIRVDDVDEQRGAGASPRDDVRTVSELRQLMTSMHDSCLYKLDGWWSYELCTARGSVRQFHAQDHQGVVSAPGDQHFLGAKRDESATILTADYLSETLLDGSFCDVSAQPRQAEVRYKCDAARETSAIVSIHEPQSCRYVVTVATPLICIHPHFAGLSRRSVNELRCQFSGANDERAAHVDALIRELRLSAPPSATTLELSVHRDGVVGVSFADLTTALVAGVPAAKAVAAPSSQELPPPAPVVHTQRAPVRQQQQQQQAPQDARVVSLAGELRQMVGMRIFNDREMIQIAQIALVFLKEAEPRRISDAPLDDLQFTQKQLMFQNELINEIAKQLSLSVERRTVLRQISEALLRIADEHNERKSTESQKQQQQQRNVEEEAIVEQAKIAVE